MKKITYKQLKNAGACLEKLRLFKKLHGESCVMTVKRCIKEASLWDWDWAVNHLLPTPAWKAYNEAIAPAEKAYNEVRAPAEKAYREARAPAWKAYREARAPAWKAYREAIAQAFAEHYLEMEKGARK